MDYNIQRFEDQPIRAAWIPDQEKYFFSTVDVCQALTGSVDGRKYWNKLKQRLKEEGNETVTHCHQLKLRAADGKMRLTDVSSSLNKEIAPLSSDGPVSQEEGNQ